MVRYDILDPALLPKFLGLAGIAGIGMFMLFVGLIRKEPLPLHWKRPLVWLLAGYCLIAALGLTYTSNFADGVFDVLRSAMGVVLLLYLLAYYRTIEKLQNAFVPAMSIAALVLIILGGFELIELIQEDRLSHQTTYEITATMANRNLLSQILVLLLPFSLWGTFSAKGMLKWGYMAVTVLSTVLIICLLVRSVWAALFAASIGTLVLRWWFRHNHKQGSARQWFVVAIPAALSLLLAFGVYGYFGTVETLQKQTSSIFNPDFGSQKDRVDLYTRSFQIAADDPILGTGPGTWKIEMLRFGTENMKSADQITFFQRPHNDWLWVLSESGIFALLFYAAVFCFAFLKLFRYLREVHTEERRTAGFMLLFGLIAYTVIAMLSFPRERIEHQIVFMVLIAGVIMLTSKQESSGLKLRLGIPIILISCLVAGMSMFVGFQRLKGEQHTVKAFQARALKQWRDVSRHIAAAQSDWYQMDAMSTPLSWYSGSAWFQEGLLIPAEQDFEKAYAIHPYHVHVLNNLASTYVQRGEGEKALTFYKKAVEIDNTFNDAYLNLAATHFNLGQIDSAWSAISNIPLDNELDNYMLFATTIYNAVADDAIAKTQESGLMWTMKRIRKDPTWMKECHSKAIENNRTLRNQLYQDCIYLMEHDSEPITSEQAQRLTKKYIKP